MWSLFLIPALCFLIFYIAILSQFGKKIFIIGILLIPLAIGGLWLNNILTSKMKVERHDIIGSYVIDRNKYSGFQADWQYNHYRFEIFEDNTIEFYVTENEHIAKTYRGKVIFAGGRHSLIIKMEDKDFHVTKKRPALYRLPWSFYYVFHSEKFNNMFFIKGKWKAINN
ncbi:MAG: hypothetical protein ACPGVD_02230 [Flavobacteriales bacterium]